MHPGHSSTQEVEAGEVGVQGQFGLQEILLQKLQRTQSPGADTVPGQELRQVCTSTPVSQSVVPKWQQPRFTLQPYCLPLKGALVGATTLGLFPYCPLWLSTWDVPADPQEANLGTGPL